MSLKHHTYQAYSHWDSSPPTLPERSRLFHLEPIGIGTPEVESLTGYIGRIAAEHSVSPRKLLFKEVFAPRGKQSLHYSSGATFSGVPINGMGELSKIIVAAFEKLTLRADVRLMTLLPWENILSPHKLLRVRRVWCAICYEESLREDKPIYDRLSWIFEMILFCSSHHVRLASTCPHCNKSLPVLATSYRPGYCSKCLSWLGLSTKRALKNAAAKSILTAELAHDLQASHILGEFLSCASRFSLPLSNQPFIANLTKHITECASRSINLFSDVVGIGSGTIRRLLVGETRLRLPVLIRLCSRLNIRPLDLLSDKGNGEMLNTRHLIIGQCSSLQKLVTPWDKVEGKLRASLQEPIPPSMEAIARSVGRYPPTIKRRFPKLCERIIRRYREHIDNRHASPQVIRHTLRAALKEQPPPPLQRVLRRLGCLGTGYYYQSNYPDMCFAITQRYLNYRNKPFDKDIDRERLRRALTEDPPPSFSEVAKRFDHSREFVRKKFPELSKAVADRYLHYQAVLRKDKAERLRHVIREAAERIVVAGLYVSEARVKEYTRHQLPSLGRSCHFKAALREVKAEMGLTRQ